MNAKYWQRGETLDYTPAAAVKNGAVVDLTTRIGIAGSDIAAGEPGQVHVVGVFEMDKDTAVAITMGAAVYYDADNDVINTTNTGTLRVTPPQTPPRRPPRCWSNCWADRGGIAMVKLTAKRPVLYQGRMYEPGDTLPAYDTRMVEAWLEADTAEMTDAEEQPAKAPTDGQGAAQEPQNTQDDQEPGQGENDAEPPQEPEQAPAMVEGHLDPKQLATMKKDALEKLADQLGVDISAAKNNAERAAILSAVIVQALWMKTGAPSDGRPLLQELPGGGHFRHVSERPGVFGKAHGQRQGNDRPGGRKRTAGAGQGQTGHPHRGPL